MRVGKRDGVLSAEGVVDPGELAAALPASVDLRPVATDDGSVVLQGRAGLFGLGASMRLRVVTVDGRVVVRPELGLLAALANYTLFADARIDVESLTATPLPDGRFRSRRRRPRVRGELRCRRERHAQRDQSTSELGPSVLSRQCRARAPRDDRHRDCGVARASRRAAADRRHHAGDVEHGWRQRSIATSPSSPELRWRHPLD